MARGARSVMDYKKVYNEDYFSGKNSFFYKFGGYGKFHPYFEAIYKSIASYVRKDRGKVLDVGCAYGLLLNEFGDEWEKYGTDISDYAVSVGRKKFPKYHLKVSDAQEAVPFKELFDVVVALDVYEHLEYPQKMFLAVHKVLAPGGIFYISTPNLNLLRLALYYFPDKMEHHISMVSYGQMKSNLKKAGFKIVDSYTIFDFLEPVSNLLKFDLTKIKLGLGTQSVFVCTK